MEDSRPSSVGRVLTRGQIDHRREVTGSEAVVYVDDSDARGAAIEHGQQRGDSSQARPVSDACRHRDYWSIHKSANDGGQRALHSGDDHERATLPQLGQVVQQPVQTGHAHVGYSLHLGADKLGGDRGLRRNRKIGGAGGQDGDSGQARVVNAPVYDDTSRHLVVTRVVDTLARGVEGIGRGTGHEEAVGTSQDRGCNCRDLLRRLALPEYHFWETLSNRAVVIDLGELDVLVGEVPELRDDLIDGETAFLKLLKYGAQPGLFDD